MAASGKPYLIFSKIFIPIGLFFAVVGGVIASETYFFLKQAEATLAVVVDFERKLTNPKTSTSASFYPIVEITQESGESLRVNTNVGSSPPAHDLGDRISVLYDPSDPEEARVNSPFGLWGTAGLFGGFGLFFLIIGFLTRLKGTRG